MGWLNPFSWAKPSAKPKDYETILSRLSEQISTARQHLSEISLRERRFSLLLSLYGLLLWAIWTGLWWVQGLPWALIGLGTTEPWVHAVIGFVGVLSGPAAIFGSNKALHAIYARQRRVEEANLRKLLQQQHEQLEEIKKATNYYSTRDLLEKYDGAKPQQQPLAQGFNRPGTPASPSPQQKNGRQSQQGQSSSRSQPQTPGTPVVPGGLAARPNAQPMSPEQAMAMQQQMYLQPALPTPNKKWYDHLADKLMGDDPSMSAQTKYALVCGGCFRHNGLVGGGKEEWEKTKWICPRCGFFNPAPKDRSDGTTASTATAAKAPSTGIALKSSSSAGSEVSTPVRQRTNATGSSSLGKSVMNAADISVDSDKMDVDEEEEEEPKKGR